MSQNTETTMISEREAVLRERAAFIAGTSAAQEDNFWCRLNRADRGMYRYEDRNGGDTAYDDAWRVTMRLEPRETEAIRRYPLPKVTRPRVEKDPMRKGFEFRAIDGRIESRQAAGECCTQWTPFEELELTANRIALWADLIKNPREEVEVDA